MGVSQVGIRQEAMADVTVWVARAWDPELTLGEWWRRLAEAGWAFPHWPAQWWGRGGGRDEVRARDRALRAAGAIGPPTGLGQLMGGPVVIEDGTDEQRQRLLGGLATGHEVWCQLFSEPGAGSDLAGLSTRAERDGDEWVITGQKVWTSGAVEADRGMLVARTNPDVPKHQGLTYFVIAMDQPGIEVRPLKQMNGSSHFNEVFLTEARVADADRIGPVDRGWAVTVATLGYERSGLSAGGGAGGPQPTGGRRAGQLDRRCRELLAEHATRRSGAHDRGDDDAEAASGFAYLRRLGGHRGAVADDALVRLHVLEEVARFTSMRTAAAAAAGRAPGPEASTAKLAWTQRLRLGRDLGVELLGPAGTLAGADAPDHGRVRYACLTIPSASIAGGSDEIQRNIAAERALGLPKDVSVDRDVPFREVPRS